jgi:hypothetical protein
MNSWRPEFTNALEVRLEWPHPKTRRKASCFQRFQEFMMKKNIWRAVIEVGFIIFLFYANLLMGEFERSGMGRHKGFASAIEDVFTVANFGIAIIAALFGYILFEFLRKKF